MPSNPATSDDLLRFGFEPEGGQWILFFGLSAFIEATVDDDGIVTSLRANWDNKFEATFYNVTPDQLIWLSLVASQCRE